jgi:hypothetical protein
MDYVILMQILETQDDAANKKLDDMFWKLLVLSQLEAEITSWHVIHDEVQIAPILKSKDHIY